VDVAGVGFAPHRYDGRAFNSQRIARPVGPTLLQREPRDSRHQLELGGPHVATWGRPRLQAAILGPVVMRVYVLSDEVTPGEPERLSLDGGCTHLLAGREPSEIRKRRHRVGNEMAAG